MRIAILRAIRDVAVIVLLGSVPLGCEREVPSTDAAGASGPAPDRVAARPEPAVLREDLVPFFRLIQARDTGAARVRLKKQLKLHPDDGQAEFLFGLSYHREKRYQLALPWFERAAAHAANYAQTQHFLGWSLYYLGETDAARAAFTAHLELQPDEADSHFAIGLIALDADELTEAEARFRRAIELRPDDAEHVAKSRVRLADVHIRRADFEAARRELIEAVALYDNHYEAYYKLFRVEKRLGNDEAAAEAERRFAEVRQRYYPQTRFPE